MLTYLDPACTCGTVEHSTTPTYVLLCLTVLGPTAADVVSDTATDVFGSVAEDHVLIERQCTWDTTVQAALIQCLFHVAVPKSNRLPKGISGT